MFRGGIASFGTRSRATIWVATTGLVCFLSGLPRPLAWAFSLCAVGAAGKKMCQSSLLTVGEHWDGSLRRFDDRRSGAAWMFRGGIASFGTRSRPTIWVAPTGLVCFLSILPRPVAWAGSMPRHWRSVRRWPRPRYYTNPSKGHGNWVLEGIEASTPGIMP